MFLAITALEDFWDASKEILFIGSWCPASCHSTAGFERPYHLMPSPWDDRERYYRAAAYVDACSEALLRELSHYLNGVHGTNHSERYWRIVLGPWLILYTSIIYDRFVHLKAAFAEYRDLETIGMLESSYRVPSNFNEAASFVEHDPYNLQIFSQLLKLLNHSFTRKPFRGSFGGPSKNATLPRERVLRFSERLMRFPFQSRAKVTVRGTSLSPVQSWKLAWATGFQALPLDFSLVPRSVDHTAVFNKARLGLSELPSKDEFQHMLIVLLPTHFPTLYLEGYRVAHARISKVRCTPLLVSGYAWYGDEEMKLYAARATEGKSCLVSVQHGGGYGVYRCAPYEIHERRLADHFLSWGWADDRKNNSNIVNPRFCELQDKVRRRMAGKNILFVATGQPRYLYRFHSCPAGSQWDGYFDWQVRFFTKLPADLQSFVRYRPYPINYGHAGEFRVQRSFPTLKWEASSGVVWNKLIEARIVIIDHLGTTLLETLAGNIPTILFWDPQRWEVRDEAQRYFERLRQAQILWHSPEGAAEKLLDAYTDPGRWWNSDLVQSARGEFVSRHALTKENWVSTWAENLENIAAAGFNE